MIQGVSILFCTFPKSKSHPLSNKQNKHRFPKHARNQDVLQYTNSVPRCLSASFETGSGPPHSSCSLRSVRYPTVSAISRRSSLDLSLHAYQKMISRTTRAELPFDDRRDGAQNVRRNVRNDRLQKHQEGDLLVHVASRPVFQQGLNDLHGRRVLLRTSTASDESFLTNSVMQSSMPRKQHSIRVFFSNGSSVKRRNARCS